MPPSIRRTHALGAAGLALLLGACDLQPTAARTMPPDLAQRIAERELRLRSSPDDVALLVELGELYMEAKRSFEAADALRAALERGGQGNVRVHAAMFNNYLNLGYVEPAIEAMKACFAIDRLHPDCLYGFGMLMLSDASPQAQRETRVIWRRFLEQAPNHPRAAYVRSQLEQLDARLGAEEPTPEGAHGQAGSPHAPPGHGASPHGAGAPGASPHGAGAPGAAPGASPHGVDGPPVPGHAGGTGGEDVGELNPFGQAIRKAFAAVRKNDAPGAEAAFREALTIRPQDPSALAGLAEALFAQEKVDPAVEAIEAAWATDPTDAQVRWAYGVIMIRSGKKVREGLAAWEKLLADEPEYAQRLGIPEMLEGVRRLGAP